MYSHDEIERANRTAWEPFESDPAVFEFVRGTANETKLERTLGEAGRVVNKPGRLVANYPLHPRLSTVTLEQVIAVMAERFRWVVEANRSCSSATT